MKRQNSSHDDHPRNTTTTTASTTSPNNNNSIYPLEMSTPPPPYNRLASHGGRRRKLAPDYAGTSTTPLSSSASSLTATASSSIIGPSHEVHRSITSPTTQPQNSHVNTNNNVEEEDNKKLQAPHRTTTNPLLHHLTTKLRHYRQKLSKLSPFQKLIVCSALILWKFIQAWLIVRGVVWLHRSGEDVGSGGDRSENWLVEGDERIDDYKSGVVDAAASTIDERKRVLYMLTVTCDDATAATRRQGKVPLSILSSTQQQRDDMMNSNYNDNNHHNSSSSSNSSSNNNNNDVANTNMDDILSNLSTDIQTMINHQDEYIVDVYWIMGCAWSDSFFGNSVPSSDGLLLLSGNHKEVEDYWTEYIANRLPDGVGLQVWEDAMPFDYVASRRVSGKVKISNVEDGDGGRVSTLAKPQSLLQHKVPLRRLEEVEEEVQLKTVDVSSNEDAGRQQQQQQQQQQSQKTFEANTWHNTNSKQWGEHHTTTTTLSPSIDKFMKQHRYVARDKLDYYDVFLSFGASLQYQPRSTTSAQRSSGIIEEGRVSQIVNGTRFEFCSRNLYRDTDITCSERVEYLTKRYRVSESEAMVGLLKRKDCICDHAGSSGRKDLMDERPSRVLERITGDHVHAYLSLSSELNELRHGEHVVPGLVAVDVVAPAAAKKNIPNSGSELNGVDASPCCEGVLSTDSMELTVEMEAGVVIKADEWQLMKVTTSDSIDGGNDTNKDETRPLSDWIAIERAKSGDTSKTSSFNFFKDGWILTKEQLLHFNSGNNRGKFLPPFLSDNTVSRIREQGLASPLFEPIESGGIGTRRAISLDPNQFSRQLVHKPVPPGAVSNNEPLGVNELLRQFHNAKNGE